MSIIIILLLILKRHTKVRKGTCSLCRHLCNKQMNLSALDSHGTFVIPCAGPVPLPVEVNLSHLCMLSLKGNEI